MSSDFLNRLRLVAMPLWSRYLFFALLLTIGFVNTVIFAYGVWVSKDSLVEATLKLLAVFLPIFTIFFVLLYIRSGEPVILQNIKSMFLDTMPSVLSKIEDYDFSFYDPKKGVKSDVRPSNVVVLTNHRAGEVYADFLVRFAQPRKEILIRLEVNFRRINFNLYLALPVIEKLAGRSPITLEQIELENAHFTGLILKALGHALQGAEYEEGHSEHEGQTKLYQSGYKFNREMIHRRLRGTDYMCLVGMKSVSGDFILDSSEKYHFSVDLMLMMRAIITECPDILVEHSHLETT